MFDSTNIMTWATEYIILLYICACDCVCVYVHDVDKKYFGLQTEICDFLSNFHFLKSYSAFWCHTPYPNVMVSPGTVQ